MPRLARFALLALILPVSLSAQTPARYDTSLFRALAWRLVGPFRGGRVTAVAGVLDQPRVYYMGATGGGVWKATDGGLTWQATADKDLTAGANGAIDLAMDPANPRVLYAGFWQAVRRPWELVSGGTGSGLWKSTDGGDSWKDITRSRGLPEGIIGKIGLAVSPVSHDRVWALVEADSGGLFSSNDGGATWRRTSAENEIRQRAWYFTHVVADPGNVDGVYVLNVTLLKSVDGGKTFTNLRAPHGDHHALWIDPRDPQRMINGHDGGATVSENGGATWTTLDNQPTAQFYHVITTTHFPYRLCGAQQD